jgi:hypothetical protein
VSDLRLKTIAMGYTRAYRGLQETYSQAYLRLPSTNLDARAAEEVWAALFEALNWLDALQKRPEAAAQMAPDLRDALRFVRGRVHHQFADAIEFRTDVLVQLTPTSARFGPRGPVAIADWCWRDATDLAGGKRASSARTQERSGETAYTNALARRQARAALDQIASLAAQLFAGHPS